MLTPSELCKNENRKEIENQNSRRGWICQIEWLKDPKRRKKHLPLSVVVGVCELSVTDAGMFS